MWLFELKVALLDRNKQFEEEVWRFTLGPVLKIILQRFDF